LLVFHYLCKLGNRHRGSAASGGQLPRVIGRERAMVLIGPIIIAVVLMALLVLGVSGIGGSRPVSTASRRAGPGTARIPGR
jgi:hypothetical protein